jgi:hypothetical protein
MSGLSAPGGPSGYLVIAQLPDVDGDEDWAKDHMHTYHGWTDLEIEAARGCDWHNEGHYAREAHGTQLELTIPHVHFFGVEYAIAESDLRPDLKLSLLTIVENLKE